MDFAKSLCLWKSEFLWFFWVFTHLQNNQKPHRLRSDESGIARPIPYEFTLRLRNADEPSSSCVALGLIYNSNAAAMQSARYMHHDVLKRCKEYNTSTNGFVGIPDKLFRTNTFLLMFSNVFTQCLYKL